MQHWPIFAQTQPSVAEFCEVGQRSLNQSSLVRIFDELGQPWLKHGPPLPELSELGPKLGSRSNFPGVVLPCSWELTGIVGGIFLLAFFFLHGKLGADESQHALNHNTTHRIVNHRSISIYRPIHLYIDISTCRSTSRSICITNQHTHTCIFSSKSMQYQSMCACTHMQTCTYT